MERGYGSQESEDFDETEMDEFGDFEEDEVVISARNTESVRSFRDIQKDKMINVEQRSINKFRGTAVQNKENLEKKSYYTRLNKTATKKKTSKEGAITQNKGLMNDSPQRRVYQDTEEFDQNIINRKFPEDKGTNDPEEPPVADEGYEEEPIIEAQESGYIYNSVTGQQEYVDEDGNIFMINDFIGPMHTKIRAEERDQVKLEKEIQEQELEVEKQRKIEEKHKEITTVIAEKGRSRVFPYGLNYSKNPPAESANEKLEIESDRKVKFKKIDSKTLNSILKDKRAKEDYLIPTEQKKGPKVSKNKEVERLYKAGESHQ